LSSTRITRILGQQRVLPETGFGVAVLATGANGDHSAGVALIPEHLDRVMTELLAVSASATSKREEAANLARIWGGHRDLAEPAAIA
jgi:hypothetical protein